MKKIILALATVALCATGAMAQQQCEGHDGNCPDMAGKMIEKRVEFMANKLSLNEMQKRELAKIYGDNVKTQAEMMEVFKMRNDENEKKIEGILNADQKAKYAKMKQQMQKRHHSGNKAHAGKPGIMHHPDNMKACDGKQCKDGKACDGKQCKDGKKCDGKQCKDGKKCDGKHCKDGKKCDGKQCNKK